MDPALFYSGMDPFARVNAVAQRLYVSASLGLDRVGGEQGRILREALDPRSLMILCVVLGGWAVTQFVPFLGAGVTILLSGIGLEVIGEQFIGAGKGGLAWLRAAFDAKNEADLNKAADLAAQALEFVEVSVISDAIGYIGFEGASKIVTRFKVGEFMKARAEVKGRLDGKVADSVEGQGARVVDDTASKPEGKPPEETEGTKPEQTPEPEETPEQKWRRRLQTAAAGAGAVKVEQEVGAHLDAITAGAVLLLLALLVGGGAALLLSRGRR